MSDQRVATMTLRGKEYPVMLRLYTHGDRPPSSIFVLEGVKKGRYGHEVTADTLEALYNEGMAATKTANVKVSIPIMQIDWTRTRWSDRAPGKERIFRSGTIIGRHGGNENLLVKWDGVGGPAQQITRFDSGFGDDEAEQGFFRPLNEQRQAEFLELLRAQDVLDKKIAEFRKQYVIDDVVQEIEQEKERVASEQEGAARE
jgi:hypothetical protein